MDDEVLRQLLDRAASTRPCPGGGIILAATPLGTALDASVRFIDALGSADIVAAEDTRRTRALADNLGVEITGKIVSNFDHNEGERAAGLAERAASGARILVVTDAGMPSVSDPGFPLVQAVRTLQSVEEAGRAGSAPMGSFDTTEAGTAPLDPPRE